MQPVIPDSPPPTAKVGRTYNHDLLRQKEAQDLCREEFPRAAAVLIDPELVAAFGQFEDSARRYKRLVRRVGTLAIVLMVFAFAGAIAGVYSIHREAVLPHTLNRLLECGSIVGLVLAFLVSKWGTLRRGWVDNRFSAEVLRLWHFRRVLTSGHAQPDDGEERARGRRESLPSLRSVLQTLAQSGRIRRAQLSRLSTDPIGEGFVPSIPSDETLRDEILRAYEKLRVIHQDEFFAERAERQFSDFAWASNSFWNATVGAITGVALAIGLVASFVTIILHDAGSWTPVIVLGSTVLGIGLRSWSEGMKFGEEEDHYESMHSVYRGLRERWMHARTTTEKLRVAQDLERTALRELRSFLHIHEHAQFVF